MNILPMSINKNFDNPWQFQWNTQLDQKDFDVKLFCFKRKFRLITNFN